ncbi:MAG: Stf0 sulfotransferase family protein [Chloroflexi bacterium]|nr:Stf0 sulfotransferase family protein [Chloroflexota bacterium]
MNKELASRIRSGLKERYADIPFPDRSYLILMSPRSGSTLLCTHLEKIGFGRPTEGFHFSKRALTERFGNEVDFSDAYQHTRAALNYGTANGIFGLKLSWIEFEIFLKKARQLIGAEESALSDVEVLEVFFPHARVIRLKRRSKVKQAVSYSKAMQTGIWNEKADASDAYKEYILPPQYNREHIEALLDNLLAFDLSWEHFLKQNSISCMEIWYEDLAQDYEHTMTAVCEYLGIQNNEALEPPLKKQSDQISQQWVERFEQETPWLKDPLIEQGLRDGDFATVFFQRSMNMARKRERAVWARLPYNRNKNLKRLIFRAKKRLGLQ